MLLVPLLSTVVVAPAQASDAGPAVVAEIRRYRAVRTREEMTIDGRGTEAVWKLAPPDGRFTERDPELGGKPANRTTLRVAYDDLALYVLVECEADPSELVVRTLRRDSRAVWSDDTVTLKLDPPHDHRTSYNFTINADGAQIDTLGLENGKVNVHQWDAVWQGEPHRHSGGWTAEFRIPFAILGLKQTRDGTIGLDITRKDFLHNANYDWRLIIPPQHPVGASSFGDLTGLDGIEAQRALEYTPYALAQTDFTRNFNLDPRRPRNLALGGEARVQVGSGSYVEASAFTDFAQVEADEVQVARDRFPLFFPERRPFFINGLDVFNFGVQKEGQLFFSRRVGLRDGQPLPIVSGAKSYGRVGPVSYGVLNVQTLGALPDEERGIEESAAENFTVARVRVQTTEILNLGVMGIGQHRIDVTNDDSMAGGVDAQIIGLDGRMQWYSFVAGTYVQDPQLEADPEEEIEAQEENERIGASAYSRLEYRGLYVRPSGQWLISDADFEPRMGFYRRPETARQEVELAFVPRPRVLGLREIEFGPRVNVHTDPEYRRVLTTEARGEVKLRWRNGTQAETKLTFLQDNVLEPFDLYLYTVDAGRYSGFLYEVQGESPRQYRFQVKPRYEYLELFGGFAHQPSLELVAKPSKHFAVRGRYTHRIGHMEDRDERYNFGFANGSVDVAFTRNLIVDSLLRVDLSPGNRRVAIQSRLRWRFAPGSDLFLVYRTDQPLGADPVGEEAREPFHQLTLKLTYYLRTLLHV